jgi:hypothetical protein
MYAIGQRTFTAGIHYLSPTDFNLLIDSSAGGVVLILPAISTYNDLMVRIGAINQTINYRWQDVSETASTNNIIFQANPQDEVNNGANIVIDTDGAGGTIIKTSENDWSLTSGSGGGAGGVGSIMPYSGNIGTGTNGFVNWDIAGSFTPTENQANFNIPRNGILDNLSVFLVSNGTSTTTFVVRVSTGGGAFADTTQTITVLGGATGQAFSSGAPVAVVKGDRISLKVTTEGGESGVVFTGGLEIK